MLAAFASVAVTLASIGVYGVLAYVVTQRTPEIGVRLAMGAAPADVVRMFVREGALLAMAGLVFGLAGAFAAARSLTTLLFGVTAGDPATFAGVAGVLLLVAFAATYIPARRPARVDPMVALAPKCESKNLTISPRRTRRTGGKILLVFRIEPPRPLWPEL